MTRHAGIPERIVGHGVDLVDVARLGRSIEDHGRAFLERVFTEGERGYAEAGGKRRIERYAARFAAKEAAFKAVGTGWRSGIAWTDAEVVVLPSGQPTLEVRGELARIANERCREAGGGGARWLVSLSHTETAALASALLMTGGGEG
ncbi:MAG: holo-ACP synthase [Phycisphaerales bacterium]